MTQLPLDFVPRLPIGDGRCEFFWGQHWTGGDPCWFSPAWGEPVPDAPRCRLPRMHFNERGCAREGEP